jgi:ankyrin repeat protein
MCDLLRGLGIDVAGLISRAAVVDRADRLRLLHDAGVDIVAAVRDPLAHVAAAHGANDVLRYLHKLGVPLNGPDCENCTPASRAARNGYPDTLRLLREQLTEQARERLHARGAFAPDSLGRSLAHFAAARGQVNVLETLHVLGEPLSSRDRAGATPAHFAALGYCVPAAHGVAGVTRGGHPLALYALHRLGVPLNEPDAEGWTPVQYATLAQNRRVVVAFHRLRISTWDMLGVEPASHREAFDVATRFRVLRGRHYYGRDLSHRAAIHGFAEVIIKMHSLNVPIDTPDDEGTTAAHFAAVLNRTVTLETLHRLGASLGALDHDGMTPAHRAAADQSLASLRVLHGASAWTPPTPRAKPRHTMPSNATVRTWLCCCMIWARSSTPWISPADLRQSISTPFGPATTI